MRAVGASRGAINRDEPLVDRSGSGIGLRLAIGKDGLGIELDRHATFACVDVVDLVIRLPNVRFPFDVTGGIAKFRHRRGELEHLSIEIDARRAARWAEPQLRGLLAPGTVSVTIAPRAYGATLTLIVQERALAFEVGLVTTPTELVLVVHGARGASLPAPATLLAMRAMSVLLGDVAKREGSRFVIPRAAERIARALLPDAGVRAPHGADVILSGSGESDGVLFVAFSRTTARDATSSTIPQATALAHEAALLSRAADDARFGGDLERARRLDVISLERAPLHPQIARRIAEVDAHAGGRAEAAVATLRSTERTAYLGRLLGDLLLEMGDTAGAIAALLREGERDPSAAIAGLCYARAAALATDPRDALEWLDSAVARAPNLAEVRWDRAARRLAHGRLLDARADFQELEALAEGALDRFEVLKRAASIHQRCGLGAEAALLYERALLYRPDDPEAVSGLGIAIAREGRATRGATLVTHAISLIEAQIPRTPTEALARAASLASLELELATILGDLLHDRSAAIAHLRNVPDDSAEAIRARGLEGRYRAALGDVAGASIAFARLRERASNEPSAVPWLEEAARFEEERGELVLAQAHLAKAQAIARGDATIEDRYREVSARIAAQRRVRAGDDPLSLGDLVHVRATSSDAHDSRAPVGTVESLVPRSLDLPERSRVTLQAPPEDREPARARETVAAPSHEPAPMDLGAESRALADSIPNVDSIPNEIEDEARVEALTQQLQGDPTNDAVVDELVVRLTRLGRGMDLLALLSARIEDAPPERKAELLPRHRQVLTELEDEARKAGRDGEADLFRMAREASGG